MMESKDSILRHLAQKYGFDVISSLKDFELIKNRQSLIPYQLAKDHGVLPVQETEDYVLVAMVDPLEIEALEKVRCIIGRRVREIPVTSTALEEALELCYQNASSAVRGVSEEDVSDEDQDAIVDDGYDLLEDRDESVVAALFNTMMKEAIHQGASDIHFEPQESGMVIRYRIDGVLLSRHSVTKQQMSQLISRIKVMSQLDIAEQRLPQDGRMKLTMAGRHIDLRVSTVPCAYGERIVLRILDKSNVMVGLSKIGMAENTLQIFRKLIHLSEGIVLVTGPTGSGKTTTLYSSLADINSSEVNIMTIEDPVEYKLEGMAQIGVNPKISLSFAAGLRHILRQDPDVIMIGEIRDRETAEIAIQASLTGHMVLSTLHTNDAPSALTRLIDMGIEPYLLSSSVVGVLAQRLVRTICPSCKTAYTPTDEELNELGLSMKDLKEGLLYRGCGCQMCFGSGYRGRRGIYELMIMNEAIKRQLLHSPDAFSLRNTAVKEGLSTLRSEGAFLVREGHTTATEVLRVTRSLL